MLLQIFQNHMEVELDELFELAERVNNQKLTFKQINKLKELISNSGMQPNEICTIYYVSYTVLNKIKKKFLGEIIHFKTRKINWVYGTKKEIIIN